MLSVRSHPSTSNACPTCHTQYITARSKQSRQSCHPVQHTLLIPPLFAPSHPPTRPPSLVFASQCGIATSQQFSSLLVSTLLYSTAGLERLQTASRTSIHTVSHIAPSSEQLWHALKLIRPPPLKDRTRWPMRRCGFQKQQIHFSLLASHCWTTATLFVFDSHTLTAGTKGADWAWASATCSLNTLSKSWCAMVGDH